MSTAKALPFAVFDEFGKGADDRVQDYLHAAIAAERERCAQICESEAAMTTDIKLPAMVAWMNVKYGTFFGAGVIAATDRNDDLIASGELIRLYTADQMRAAIAAELQEVSKAYTQFVLGAHAKVATERDALRAEVEALRADHASIVGAYESKVEALRVALLGISLCSQNSSSSRIECGRLARAALDAARSGEPT